MKMKKGLINMIALVLTLVNLILTGLLAYAIIPTMLSTKEVVTRIGTILDLDSVVAEDGETSLGMDEVSVYSIEDKLTIPLADDGTGSAHYFVAYVSVYFDKSNENYETYYADIATQVPLIKSTVEQVVGTYTYAEIQDADCRQDCLKEIKDKLNEMYGTELVYKVIFTSPVWS